MIKINFDKYGKIRNLDFGEETIFKGNNRVNQIFVAFDDVSYNPNHYMTYSALINENDYEGNLTDLATAKTTIDGVEGYTFYLFSNLTAKAGELKLSVRLVDRTTERVLVSGIIPLVIEDTAISTYASVDITKTQYNALLTAFDELSQSIDATNFKTINGESIYGEGDIVVLTGDVMVDYVGQEISNVNDSLWNLSQRINDVETENAELNALIEKQDKKIKQLELASEGNILSTITESDSAYEVGVGVDTLPFATIDKIGGMTIKSENLLDENLLKTNDGTFTKQSDNSYISKALGSYGSAYFNSVWNSSLSSMVSTNGISLSKGTYYISFKAKLNSGTSASGVGVSINLENTKKIDATAVTNPTLSSSYQNYIRTITLTADDKIGISFLVGGNASSAVIQIKDIMISRINTTYQPYFEGLRDSKVTEIISAGANLINPSDLTHIESATLQKDGSFLSSSLNSWNGIKLNASYNASASADRSKNGINLKKGTYYISIKAKIISGNSCNINSLFVTRENTKQISSQFVTKPSSLTSVYQEYKGTFTLDTDDKIGIVVQVDTNASNSIIQVKDIMIAKENIDYKPYKQPTAIAIPTAIQNLDGYGLGVDATCYNYVDFESKKFVKMIGSYTFTGSEGFGQANTNTSGVYRYFTEVLKNIAVGVKASNVKGALLMADVNTTTADESYLKNDGVCIDSNGRLYFFNSDIQSTTDMANYLKGKTVYFALATPVAEDLSHIIDDEILTEVESGGTLTFENEYKQDVPFTWTFQEKL